MSGCSSCSQKTAPKGHYVPQGVKKTPVVAPKQTPKTISRSLSDVKVVSEKSGESKEKGYYYPACYYNYYGGVSCGSPYYPYYPYGYGYGYYPYNRFYGRRYHYYRDTEEKGQD